ncbi:hypothetical protein EDB85DRAFT_1476144 [Lactarius pseudohatsudake]|nr:hypothetical protein EDB85DRAFT_1476144 [Lactarius pseudohatsudake]
MNPNQENSRENQRRAIDAEIRLLQESLQESLQALRLRRNALAPISSLPPELFAAIFSILRLPPSGTVLLGGAPDPHLSWLNVAHVCHQWREVALNQPFFWSHIDFTTLTPAGATEMLVRAKSVPLYLEAWVPKYHWDGARFSTFQRKLQSRVSHICQLAISARPLSLEWVLEGLVSPAPILKYLSLSGKKKNHRKQASVADTLFNGSTPRLSRLDLWGCDISWKSPLFRGLKHLKIYTLSTDARPSLSVWLDALEEIPQLKTLVLHSASPITSSFPFDVERISSLPNILRYLRVSGGLWARTRSSRPTGSYLAVRHSIFWSYGWRRRAKNAFVYRTTCPRTPGHGASAERAHPRPQPPRKHPCVARARYRRGSARSSHLARCDALSTRDALH